MTLRNQLIEDAEQRRRNVGAMLDGFRSTALERSAEHGQRVSRVLRLGLATQAQLQQYSAQRHARAKALHHELSAYRADLRRQVQSFLTDTQSEQLDRAQVSRTGRAAFRRDLSLGVPTRTAMPVRRTAKPSALSTDGAVTVAQGMLRRRDQVVLKYIVHQPGVRRDELSNALRLEAADFESSIRRLIAAKRIRVTSGQHFAINATVAGSP